MIDGAKTFITNGFTASLLVTAVRTGGPGSGGVSLVELEAGIVAGFRVGRRLEKLGRHALRFELDEHRSHVKHAAMRLGLSRANSSDKVEVHARLDHFRGDARRAVLVGAERGHGAGTAYLAAGRDGFSMRQRAVALTIATALRQQHALTDAIALPARIRSPPSAAGLGCIECRVRIAHQALSCGAVLRVKRNADR